MTSLAHQLKRLALPQNDASLLTRTEIASLLFEPKDAAAIDRSTFYALGCTGLEELLGIETAFLEFQDTLFSSASQTMERSVQSKEVNQKLDASISLFLTRLCPYFLLKPAHKCLEWLIHRFHIHLYNVDSLLACILPYHDTNIFVRVLQLLKIQDATNKWNWLHCLQKPGVPLSRGALITHCYSDLGFMDFICSLVTKSIEAFSAQTGSCSQLRIIFSFYASTIVAALDAVDRVSDSIISKLLPYIQKGMKSPLQDYKAATYMIVCQLAVKVVMEATLVDKLAIHISKSLLKEPLLAKEGVACLVVLLQNQQQAAVEPRALDHLSAVPALVSTLQEISAYDVTPLLRHLLPHLVHAAFTPGSGKTDSLAVLTSLLEAVPLGEGLDQTVARLLLEDYLGQTELSDDQMAALNQRLLPFVRVLESRYCGSLDSVLESHVADISSEERKRLFHQFLSLSVSSGKFQFMDNSDTSLLLSLKHTQPTIRVSAMEHLMGVITSGQRQSLDRTFLRDAVLERLQDDVPEVVTTSLKVLEVLVDDLDPEDVMSSLLTLLHRQEVSLSESWLPALTEAVRLLSGPWLGTGERLQTAGWRLLPLLIVSSDSSSQLSLASCIGHSSIMAQQLLTQNWNKELDKLTKFRTKPDFVALANERLIATLTRNLADMQQPARRDALEKLTLVVEGLQGSSVATRTTFLVLTRTLLLSLGDPDEEEHLRTCQRVYALLEPRLLEVVRNDGEPQEDQAQVFVPSSFSDGLTSYLSCGGAGYSSVLLCLLRDLISSLKCRDASCKGDVWWNPEKLDTSGCRYLGLMCRLFSVMVSGAGEGPAAATCRELMKLLFQIHLPEPLTLFRFLCVLWGYSSNHSNQLDIKVGAVLQTQALYVGGALLAIHSTATLEMLAAANSPVFPSLLCCLCSPVREVRRAALGALRSLSAASGSPFQPITEKLLRTSEEIIADPAYLSQALGTLHDSCLAAKKKSQQEALLAALHQLLLRLQDPCCPSYSAAVLMEALSQVNGESILCGLLPLLDRLLEQSGPDRPALLRTEAQLISLLLGKYNEASAPLLAKDQKCLDLFVRVLESSTQPFPDAPSYQICALEQMTKLFFSALGDERVQQKLLSVMFDLLADNRSPLVANSVGSVFKAIAVDGQLVANELTPPEKPSVGKTVLQTRRSRMSLRKTQEGGEAVPEGGAVSWRRVTLILELLQKKKKLKRPHTLVPVLFSLLARSLETHSADDSNMEYTKQLLLSCLLNVCHKVSPEGGAAAPEVLDEDKFSVELVVQCIRTSDMPQTHHHGLLLLGAAAAIFPEKVLHNIMPIFTFMGANVMRLDDAYSFQVIDKTVQMVVPALIQAQQLSGDSSSPCVDIVVTKIMHVFADALPHVPAHRRVPVLAQLVSLLGPAHYLWVLMALLFKLHATQAVSSASDKEAALQADMDFWISVSCHFEVNEQLTSLINLLNFLLQLPDDKDDNAASGRSVTRQGSRKKKGDEEEKVEEVIFSVESHSGKELRHFKFICVSFMAQLLGSNSFIGKVVDGADDSSESLEQLQQKLLQDILRYIHCVARCVEENAGKPTAKFWRVLLNKAYDVLDKVNSLLPADTFITVVKGLMGNELPSVRRKAMELLNNKLQHRAQWSAQQVSKIMQLTDDFLKIACRSPSAAAGEEEEAEQAINRQTALYSLKLLSRSFGASHQEALLRVLKQTAALVTSPEEEKNVMGSALLCIAETVGVLKTLAIPQLPRLMPAVLHTLTDRKDLRSSDIYLLSAVTALQRVIETLPHFISPYLQDVMSQVCRLTKLVESSSSSSSSSSSPTAQLCTRLASLSSTLSTKVPPRVLLPTITKCYNSMVADRKAQLGALMVILREHIAHMEKEELNAQQTELTAFFLTALDFRAEHCQGNLDETAAVEGSVIDCLLAMVMKLSEVTFRPLFFKLFDWTKSGSTERLLTFYRLTDSVAGRLKGLFVLFAGNLVKPFTDLLRQTNTSKTGDVLFKSSNGEQKVALLLGYILDCMQKIFLYDTQRFLSRERADALTGPLLDQLENMVGGLEQYQQRVTQHLMPCVGQFIVALNDDAQWKNVNYQILLRSRHAHSQVRFSSLLLLLEVASKLKENYMVLLPETIPFLAELMEDECEEVEQQVQKVVQEMENILGEPLQSYF